jgi:hypothetical protein
VQAHGQDAGVVVEGRLHAVAVVHVDIHVRDPLGPQIEQPRDGDRRVVVHAEPGRSRRHRVVQAARDVHRPRRRAAPDRFRRGEGGAADPGARVVHALEDRIVGSVEAPAAEERVVRSAAHGREIVGPVHPGQRRVVGRGGHEKLDAGAVEDAELAGEGHGELDPDRVHRMVTHVVGEQRLVPHHRSRLRHGLHAPTSAGNGISVRRRSRLMRREIRLD